jgi:hypothetical protein
LRHSRGISDVKSLAIVAAPLTHPSHTIAAVVTV